MGYVKSVEPIAKVRFKSLAFSHKGSRLNNEDYSIADDLEGIYILTDGMGGYKGGEIASRMAAHACYDYLIDHPDGTVIPDDLIDFVRLKFTEVVLVQPDFRYMGTTLCCVYIRDEHIHVIHIGDSKIIVEGDGLFHSTDHTYAQQLVDSHIIDSDEYGLHPMRHILTRCITAKTQEKYKADFHKIPLKTGRNTFFLCSDGVMETFSVKEIIQLFRTEPDIQRALQTVEQKTTKFSKDNSTAIIGAFNHPAIH